MLKNNTFFLFLFILILALFLRTFKLTHVGFLHSDEITFFSTIQNLSQHPFLSESFFRTLIKPPQGAYAAYGKSSHILFHSFFYSFFKNNAFYFLFLSVFWSLLTIVLIYMIGNTFFEKKIGVLASLFLTVSVFDVQYARSFLSHSASVFFVVLASYLYLKRKWFLSGVCLGIGATFHGTVLYFLPAFILCEIRNFRSLISFSFATTFPFLIYEMIGLFIAKYSFLYNFFLVSDRQKTEEITHISPLYTLKQFWISHGAAFSISILVALTWLIFKLFAFALWKKEKKYFFILMVPLFFFANWTFKPNVINNYFRYFVPLTPFLALWVAILYRDLLKGNSYKKGLAYIGIVLLCISQGMQFSSFLKSSLHSFSSMAKTIQHQNIQKLAVFSPFFRSYLYDVYPLLKPSLSIYPVENIEDAKKVSATHILIEGKELDKKKTNPLLQFPHDTFDHPFYSYKPFLFALAYESNQISLVEETKKNPHISKIFLFQIN